MDVPRQLALGSTYIRLSRTRDQPLVSPGSRRSGSATTSVERRAARRNNKAGDQAEMLARPHANHRFVEDTLAGGDLKGRSAVFATAVKVINHLVLAGTK